MPPKSKEFHRIVQQVLAPVLADLGFSRPRSVGLGGWARQDTDGWLVIWVQLNRNNYGDSPEGFTFTVEMQLNTEPIAGFDGPRARLYELLTEDEKAEHLVIHNEVIVKTRPDPAMLAMMEPIRQDWYRAEFERRTEPFSARHDPWFRYADEPDARRWLEFVAAKLPGAIARFEASVAAGTLGP